MLRFFKILAPAALLTVSACATPFQANVSRFQQLPAPHGQSFAIVADNPRLNNSLEFAQYANIVADRLGRVGYARANSFADANLVVHLNYGVDHGRERIRSSGGFGGGYGSGFGGFGYGGYGYGGFGYGGFGRRSYIYGFNDPFLFGSSYGGIDSYTVYESELEMTVERKATRERLFEGTARAMSTDDDLTRLVPNLIQAMFTNFPGNSGQTVKITIAPPDRRHS